LKKIQLHQKQSTTIRILIADDHEVVREGLRYSFLNTDIEIVAEAETGQQAVRLAVDGDIDVVLLDVRMPDDGDGIAGLAEIKAAKPRLPVLMYSAHDRPDIVRRCRALGAYRCLSKHVDKQTLLAAIRDAHASTITSDASAAVRVLGTDQDRQDRQDTVQISDDIDLTGEASMILRAATEVAPQSSEREMRSLNDPELHNLVSARFRRSGYPYLRGITIRCSDGAVELSGTVPTFHLKQMAQELAARTLGICHVINDLQVTCIGRPIEPPGAGD